MFVFEKGKEINIVLEGSLPKETPDFVIAIDEDAKTVTVNGTVIPSQLSDAVVEDEVEEEEEVEEPVEETTEEPTVNEGETEE